MRRSILSRSIHVLSFSLLAAMPAWSQEPLPDDLEELEEVLVTGSFIRRDVEKSPSPVELFNRASLESSGSATLTDFVKDITLNLGSEFQTDTFTQNATQGTASVNLRGLGLGSTLVLINGKRSTLSASAANDGQTFVDINSFPQIMVEQVEVLKEGAAATYGSDAVAGVINFILNEDFEGFELTGGYQTTTQDNQEDMNLGALWGFGSGDTHVVIGANYFKRTPLYAGERDFTRGTGTSDAGNPGAFLFPTALIPPILIPPGVTVPPFAPLIDPACSGAPKSTPNVQLSVIPGVVDIGTCQMDFIDAFDLVTEEERIQTMAIINHRINDSLNFYSEILYSEIESSNVRTTASFPLLDFPYVPATNPYSPLGTNLANNVTGGFLVTDTFYIGRALGMGSHPAEGSRENSTQRIVLGLEGDLRDDWTFDTSVQYSINDYELRNTDVLEDRFQAALLGFGGAGCTGGTPGAGGCLYWNPTGQGQTSNPASLIAWVLGEAVVERESSLFTADAVVSGAFGDIGAAFGVQYRKETLEQEVDPNYAADNYAFFVGGEAFDDAQDVWAVFSEFVIPMGDSVEAQVALRYEDYGENVGDSIDPKIALRWDVSDSVTLRGSASTSFRAPSLHQQSGGAIVFLDEIFDPVVGQSNFTAIRPRGNDDLDPEEAVSYNIGVVFKPMERMTATVDAWKIEVDDVIIKESAQAIVNANPVDARITRNPLLGSIQMIETRYINSGEIDTQGVDLTLSYDWDTSVGLFRLSGNSTFVDKYELIDKSVSIPQEVDGAGSRNYNNFARSIPDWRARLALDWQMEAHSVNATVNYIDSYEDDQINTGELPGTTTRIDSWTTLNLQYAYMMALSEDQELTMTLGVLNATDEDPPEVNTNMGFDTKIHDPRGRMVYARIKYAF